MLLALVDNSTDLAITGQPPESLDVVAQHIMDNPPVISVTHDHVLVALPVIPLTRMVEETLVVREPGSGTRASMERHFASQRVAFQAGCEFGTNEALKQAVRAGLVLGAVSSESIELELSTGCLVVLPVKGFPVVRQWYVLHCTHKRVSAAARTFREMLLGLEVPE